MRNSKTTVILLLLINALTAQGQFFVEKFPLNELVDITSTYVVNNDGDTIRGRLTNSSYVDDRLKTFTIKNNEGKYKFNIENARRLAVQPWYDENADSGPISVPNILRAMDSTFNKTVIMDWVFYDRIQLPNKKEKYAFVQLLNPGFDSKIKVYQHQNANQTGVFQVEGVTLAGDDDTSHLIVIDGAKSFVMRKNKYKSEAMNKLFNNCTEIEDLRWRNFAKQVYKYDTRCD